MNNNKLTIKVCVSRVLLLVTLVIAGPLHALEFECSSGTDSRFIRQELPGITHLCEVTVTNINDERRVMWYANHDTAFCSEKTIELKDKYEKEWGFQCEQWPDHDGVDQLSDRHRTILDAELKFIIEQGQNQSTPYVVEGLKAAASPETDSPGNSETNTLVVQFFLHVPENDTTQDVTHIIRDDGVSWNTLTKIDTLANYIDAKEGYVVNSALISNVTDNGAMEVITVIDTKDSSVSNQSDCYGNQTLAAQNNGELIARTPHRFVCANAANNSDAG